MYLILCVRFEQSPPPKKNQILLFLVNSILCFTCNTLYITISVQWPSVLLSDWMSLSPLVNQHITLLFSCVSTLERNLAIA